MKTECPECGGTNLTVHDFHKDMKMYDCPDCGVGWSEISKASMESLLDAELVENEDSNWDVIDKETVDEKPNV